MANDLINLIPKDAEEMAAFIEAVQTIRGASKAAQSAVAKYFGPVFERNWRQVTEKAKKLRDKIPPERHSEPSPSVLIPLVEGASQESRDELQDRWAALLANAMIDGGIRVRQGFAPALSKFDPPDVLVLRAITNIPHPLAWHAPSASETNRAFIEEQMRELRLSLDEWEASCQNLLLLGCIAVAQNHTESIMARSRPHATSFGKQLLAACTVV